MTSFQPPLGEIVIVYRSTNPLTGGTGCSKDRAGEFDQRAVGGRAGDTAVRRIAYDIGGADAVAVGRRRLEICVGERGHVLTDRADLRPSRVGAEPPLDLEAALVGRCVGPSETDLRARTVGGSDQACRRGGCRRRQHRNAHIVGGECAVLVGRCGGDAVGVRACGVGVSDRRRVPGDGLIVMATGAVVAVVPVYDPLLSVPGSLAERLSV
jgi:hypothetical protein